MKIINTILILLTITNWAYAQESNCVRTTYFGESKICLPKIEGYQECYLDSIVKQLADGTEVPINMVLGYYLNEKTYSKKDSLGILRFDDYFKVYGTKQIKDLKADRDVLKQLEDILAGNFISKNWDSMKKEVDKIGMEVEIGVPTMIKSYKYNENSFTYVLLIKYEIKGLAPYTMATTANGLLKGDRLIWLAYYLNYEGEETISRIQNKTNLILTEFLK